ncbi:hypothetical protein HDV57DRAFT_526577 [Trichoderma longibrachiatum]
MSDPWEELDNEVPDFVRDPDCHPFDHASPEIQNIIIAIQRYNLAYFEHHSMVPAGVRLYLDKRGMIQRAGAPPIDNLTPGDGKFMFEDLWGPGAEAGVAWRLIDKAPTMKHTTWAETQQKLLEHFGPPQLQEWPTCHWSSQIFSD